jgi:hypothetical protein
MVRLEGVWWTSMVSMVDIYGKRSRMTGRQQQCSLKSKAYDQYIEKTEKEINKLRATLAQSRAGRG